MAWVTPYLESPWVKIIAGIAPAFPPPGDKKSEEWQHFASAVFIGGGVLAGIGVLAAITVLVKSCISCHRRAQARPSTKPLICTAILTFLFVAVGVIFYWTLESAGVKDASNEFKDITADVKLVQAQGLELAKIGTAISTTLNATIPLCPPDFQVQLRDRVSSQVEGFRAVLSDFNDNIKDFPRQLDNATKILDAVATAGVYGLGFPLALSLLCVLAIVFIVCATRGGQGSGNCSHCCIRLMGPLLFAPAILVVTALTAAEFAVSLGTASFCKDADTNTLTYVQKYGSNDTYEATRFYITGKGSNPFLADFQTAQEELNQTQLMLEAFAPALEQACHSPEAVASIKQGLQDTAGPIGIVDRLLAPSHIYPYYKMAVHDNACKTLISGVCWLVVFQLLVGLLCLPCLTLMADSFFERWRAWHSNPGGQGLLQPEMSV